MIQEALRVLYQDRQEAIIAAITNNMDRLLVGDYPITSWEAAGLLFHSTATVIICTIKQTMIERRLGSMPSIDMQAIDDKLRETLCL